MVRFETFPSIEGAKVLPQLSALVVNSQFSRLMKEDGGIDKPWKGSSEKSVRIRLGKKSCALKRMPHFCTLLAMQMIFC